ncbi:MAG TPA: MFS transporter, partial [Kofleriaceae bacterium]|nr:MFS transporter [Kofleriaceae bacterium]
SKASDLSADDIVSKPEVRKVIIASSLGTVFEWYDFYLYAVLTPFFSGLFFPKGNETAALMGALGAYAAGFLVRPFGALFFGRIGDLVGRKYTFLITIVVMGFSTFAVGLLPSFATIGWAAPILLVILRLLQGLALGGEYGGAATYVAEHSPPSKRGYVTSWIQTTATVGLLLALIVIYLCRSNIDPKTFAEWGWRVPFALSVVLLGFSIYIRLKLNESPVFQKMKSEGRGSKSPLTDSFLRYPNNKFVFLALFGATAGQAVVWYTGQFQALFFLTGPLKLEWKSAYLLIGLSLVIGTPFFLVFGRLSDKIGRLKIILAGCAIAAITYFPLFHELRHAVNPALDNFNKATEITVADGDCTFRLFPLPNAKYTDCDKVKNYLTSAGISFSKVDAVPGQSVVTKIGDVEIRGFDEAKFKDTIKSKGYPDPLKSPDNFGLALLILVIFVIYVTMVYGPIAAFLVELFPTKIRYTSMSLPYHIGNGWFGGLLPLTWTAMVASSGNIFQGLWYPIVVSVITVIVGGLFLRQGRGADFDIHQ